MTTAFQGGDVSDEEFIGVEMRSRRLKQICAIVLTWSLTTASAEAELIITIGDADIAAGGSGWVEVDITATNPSDNLAAYFVGFSISTVGGRELHFVDPQSESHLSDPNYVFASTGSASITGPPSGNVDINGLEFITSDVSDDSNGVFGPFTHLLARLDLTALTAFAPQAGDVFNISVLASQTTLFDSNFDVVNYSSNVGQVTVSSVASVPEPSSLVLAGLGGTLAFVRHRRRQASNRRQCESTSGPC